MSADGRGRAGRVRLPDWWPWAALAVLLAVGLGVLVAQTSGTLFWADEWQWILTRRGGGLDTFLTPHNEHFSLVPVIIYKLLFAIAGLRHYWPYRGVLITVELVVAGLVFLYVRRRAGDWLALCAVALLLFFGPGWQDTLWPFQTAWILTVLGGVGAALALDRRDRFGDVLACLLLVLAVASASPGVAVVAGVLVELLLTRRRRDLWIALIPVAVYGIWYLDYEQTTLFAHSLLLVPHFMFDSAAGTLSAITGLAQINPLQDSSDDLLSWGVPLLALALIALVWRLRSWGRVPPRVAMLGGTLIAFWLLTGIGRAYVKVGPLVLTATGFESRYLYIGAAFMILLAAEALRRPAGLGWIGAAVVGVLTLAACLSNYAILEGGSQLLHNQAQYTEADLETMNLSRPIVSPGFVSNGFVFGYVTARVWFAAERDLGSPPLSPAQLAAAPEFARETADNQLVRIQQLALAPTASPHPGTGAPTVVSATGGLDSPQGGCVRFLPAAVTAPGATHALTVAIRSGGLLVRAGTAGATVAVSRFAATPTPLGSLAAGTAATLSFRPDLASVPWHVQVSSPGTFSLCGAGS